ncbi:MAG: flagellar assembly protein FliW [Deltaproteobacteria bacterium]|nr:flagellar assembly protein FliW [Deltaproteobacteria bacterium]
MKISTTRFGELELNEADVFHFSDGIIGFPDFQYFVVLEHNPGSPFKWIQSTTEPEMAFVVVDPLLLDPDYPMDKVREAIATDKRTPKDIGAAVIAVVPPAPHPITVNLLAPLALDPELRTGRQVILNGTDYTTRHVIVQEEEPSSETGTK